MNSVVCLPTLDQLRQHVLEVLCANDRLDPVVTELRESVLIRKDTPCGLFFQARGARQIKTYAVWAGEEDRILFYASTGERFAETRLSEAPDPAQLRVSARAA